MDFIKFTSIIILTKKVNFHFNKVQFVSLKVYLLLIIFSSDPKGF